MTIGECYLLAMLGRTYPTQACGIARTLELVGERWTLLIVRDAIFRGPMRFSELERNLGVAPNILTKRLEHLVESGILKAGGEGETRRYEITERGLDLVPMLIAATAWGEKWANPGPIDYVDKTNGHEVSVKVVDDANGAEVAAKDVGVRLRG
ncbi:MAG: helix-turn-helix domain-containing protein [Croceibacterium sp.]